MFFIGKVGGGITTDVSIFDARKFLPEKRKFQPSERGLTVLQWWMCALIQR